MATIRTQRFEFVRKAQDRLTTQAVALGGTTAKFRLAVTWSALPREYPQDDSTGAWFLDLYKSNGDPIVTCAPIRDRTDCLLGVSTAGRPAGAIIAYDPKSRGDLTINAWTTDGVLFLYLPDGFVPNDFAAY